MYEAAALRAKESEARLEEMEKVAQETETSLSETKGRLVRIKGAISQNRISELESEIKRLKRENNEFKDDCARMERSQKLLMTRCEAQEKDISALKLTIEQLNKNQCTSEKDKKIKELEETLAMSKSERESLLENMLTKRNMERTVMSSHISKLEIQIAFLNRKKNEEIANIKAKKQKETHALRDKLSTMYHRQKSQNRECRWKRRENTLSEDEDIELELSPDHTS